MLDEEVDRFNTEIGLSALGEIANMITGNAATRLAQAGYPCQISPPVIIEPVGTRFTTGSITIGMAAHETFTCSSCQTMGQVATRLTCTSCGTENWWGWYPPQQ